MRNFTQEAKCPDILSVSVLYTLSSKDLHRLSWLIVCLPDANSLIIRSTCKDILYKWTVNNIVSFRFVTLEDFSWCWIVDMDIEKTYITWSLGDDKLFLIERIPRYAKSSWVKAVLSLDKQTSKVWIILDIYDSNLFSRGGHQNILRIFLVPSNSVWWLTRVRCDTWQHLNF